MKEIRGNIIKLFLLIAICLLRQGVIAQVPGFHGRKLSLSIGSNLNSVFVNQSDPYLHDKRIKSLLPPKINLGMEYSVGKRTNLYMAGSFYPMPDTEFYLKNSSRNGLESTQIVDSFKLRSNMWSISAGFRRYASFSHYGKFTSLGMSGNYFNSIIYPTVYTKVTNNGITTKNEIEKLPVGREWTYNLAVYIGRGKSYITKKYTKIDYGVNVWLFLGQNNYKVTSNYRDDVAGIVDHLMNKRAREAHLVEVFVNIGILK